MHGSLLQWRESVVSIVNEGRDVAGVEWDREWGGAD